MNTPLPPPTPQPTSPTIAGLLPAKVRRVVYAVLTPVLAADAVVHFLPAWAAVVLIASGFTLAAGNTPRA